MSMYLIGDVQGCDAPLGRLLRKIDFSPSRDKIFFLGDLVNRGPESAATLRRIMSLGSSARSVLGNHDLHLLAVAHGVKKTGKGDTIDDILNAPDREEMLSWLASQSMGILEDTPIGKLLMVHAGVLPAWTAEQVVSLGKEVHDAMKADPASFFSSMYGNKPNQWTDSLDGDDRLRVVVNALTRIRLCHADGSMDFSVKEGAAKAPAGMTPWFDLPDRRTADVTVAFGHWSTLGLQLRDNLVSLDTGCIWGGCLSALKIDSGGKTSSPAPEVIQIKCDQEQVPG